jgi:hypothetical protein
MDTQQFLDYLREHPTTRNLAEDITYALVLRGRSARATRGAGSAAAAAPAHDTVRIAS